MKKLAILALLALLAASVAAAAPNPKGVAVTPDSDDYVVNLRLPGVGGYTDAPARVITVTPEDEIYVVVGVLNGESYRIGSDALTATEGRYTAAGLTADISVGSSVPLNANQPNVLEIRGDYIRLLGANGIFVKLVVEY